MGFRCLTSTMKRSLPGALIWGYPSPQATISQRTSSSDHRVTGNPGVVYGERAPRTIGRDVSSIPGPRSLPLIGTAWTLFPLIGADDVKRLHRGYYEKYRKYGKIVRENFVGKQVVSVYDPADIETVFRKEGRYPVRISHEILLQIRKEHPDLYHTRGLVPTNNEEWGTIRERFQQELNKIEIISRYLPNLDATSREFIDYLRDSRDEDGVIPDLLYKMHEWALENVCVNVLDTRLDQFKATRNPLCRELIQGANEALEALLQSEYVPVWKVRKTKGYKKITEVDILFYRVAEKYVNQKLRAIKRGTDRGNDDVEKSVLEKYLRYKTGHDLRDIVTLASDLLFTGLLTTAVTTSFVMYHLSRNPEKQEVLFQELKTLLPDWNKCLTSSALDQMNYLKACVKESMRINPVSIGTSRTLASEVILSGYRVPPGIIIITQNHIASNLPDYVDDPDRFLPERWLRQPGVKRPHPYLVLPFGAGPRSCVGRRFAELEMYVFVALLIRRYKLEWKGTRDVSVETRMLNIPDRPMDIKATLRHDS